MVKHTGLPANSMCRASCPDSRTRRLFGTLTPWEPRAPAAPTVSPTRSSASLKLLILFHVGAILQISHDASTCSQMGGVLDLVVFAVSFGSQLTGFGT